MKFRIAITEDAKQIVENLSIRQLINQVCCPTYSRVGGENVEEFGAMFFHPTEREKVVKQIEHFQSRCDIPPFIVSDLECGAGSMLLGATKFPSMMGLSQTNSKELAYETGKIAAREARQLGYNWTFAPVADLAYDLDGPVVTTRSAGKQPEHVIQIISSYMKGLQDNGMMATIKHFPGDGYSSYDQHLTTVENPLDMETWRKYPGKVFQEMIKAGVKCVMPGHISLPAYDDIDEKTGMYPPATISKRILQNLLRDELSFGGLIVTDAVEMGGLVGYMNYFDSCALALENGCDCLLFPRVNEHFYQEMEKRIESGLLSIDTLRDRAVRIVSIKQQEGLFERKMDNVESLEKEYMNKIAKDVVANSITVVRDRKELIPFSIKKNTKVLHVVILNNYQKHTDMLNRMQTEISKYTAHVTQWIDPGPDRLYQAVCNQAYDLIICSIGSRHSFGLNVIRLHDEIARNMMGGWTKIGTPIIFVAHFHPFVHKEYEASIDTIINTYGDIDCSARYIMEGITGQRPLKREVHVHD